MTEEELYEMIERYERHVSFLNTALISAGLANVATLIDDKVWGEDG